MVKYLGISISILRSVELAFQTVELKEQYDLELFVKEKLETKANNMTTISGVAATLIFGFSQLYVSKLAGVNYQYLNVVNALLAAALVTSVIAIIFSVVGWRIQEYKYVVGTGTVDRSTLVYIQNAQTQITSHNNNKDQGLS
jgi:hypothetical protein